jgi:hypothetical protein
MNADDREVALNASPLTLWGNLWNITPVIVECFKSIENNSNYAFSIFGVENRSKVFMAYSALVVVSAGVSGYMDYTKATHEMYTMYTGIGLFALPHAVAIFRRAYDKCVATEEHQALLPRP